MKVKVSVIEALFHRANKISLDTELFSVGTYFNIANRSRRGNSILKLNFRIHEERSAPDFE